MSIPDSSIPKGVIVHEDVQKPDPHALQWSPFPPDEPGWYWLEYPSAYINPVIVQVIFINETLRIYPDNRVLHNVGVASLIKDASWAGPISLPQRQEG